MKRILFSVLFAASLSAEAQTQTVETAFARPLNREFLRTYKIVWYPPEIRYYYGR